MGHPNEFVSVSLLFAVIEAQSHEVFDHAVKQDCLRAL